MPSLRRRRAAPWLLAVAALCLLAQSTVWPVVAPSMATWDPAHRHITSDGAVPEHVHSYEEHSDSTDAAACRVTSEAPREDGTDGASLVCAASSDGATTSVTTALHGTASDVPGLSGATTSSLLARLLPPPDAALSVLTPPPRG